MAETLDRLRQMASAVFALLFLMLAVAFATLWISGTLNAERLSLIVKVIKGTIHEPAAPGDSDLRARYEELLRRERQADAMETLRREEANRMAAVLQREREALEGDRATQGVAQAAFVKERDAFISERGTRASKAAKEGLKRLQQSLEGMDPEEMVNVLVDLDEPTLLSLTKEFKPDLRAELLALLQQNLKMSAKNLNTNQSPFDRLIDGLRK